MTSRLHLKKKKVMLHKDNAPCHKSMKTIVRIDFELIPYPPYSPDLEKFNAAKKAIGTVSYFETKDRQRNIKIISKNCMTSVSLLKASILNNKIKFYKIFFSL